jgi:HAD superfamily hydrolase (TIGR01484 family)
MVPVTGRPAGWCDQLARMWPVAGVVGENGALYFCLDSRPGGGRMHRRYQQDEAARADGRRRLESVRAEVLAAVPGCRVSADQAFRETDLAIDYCEDVPRLGEAEVGRIVEVFRRHRATAKVSSIHVNGWFGGYDKLAMCRTFAAEVLGVDLEAERERFVFVGDSPNDEPMFRFFPHAVGVANVRAFAARLGEALPRHITEGAGGEGFAELIDAVLAGRQGSDDSQPLEDR